MGEVKYAADYSADGVVWGGGGGGGGGPTLSPGRNFRPRCLQSWAYSCPLRLGLRRG